MATTDGRIRLIVGIDYGTTYSGIAYITDDKSADDMTIIDNWPGRIGERKTPTRIAYPSENSELTANAWGFKAEGLNWSCSWTKLLLDMKSDHTVHDDPKLREAAAADQSVLHLPEGKTPEVVCQDFLHELYVFFRERLRQKGLSDAFLKETPMECWLTVPAVWSDAARAHTRKAAEKAGFISKPSDRVIAITEPEAAAITVLKQDLRPDAVNPPREGDVILVCDCGGGTVDLITYTIERISPALKFKELCKGTGGKCGATYLDRQLLKLMEDRFGSCFTNMPLSRRGPGSKFMNEWEREKRDFNGLEPGDTRPIRIGPLKMKGDHSAAWFDDDEDMVLLTRQDIKQVFDVVIGDIKKLVDDQFESAEAEKQDIDRLILIGGFGDSPYLLSTLRTWCKVHHASTQVYGAEHSQTAIVKGAVLRGLHGTVPSTRRCRRHYGIATGMSFRRRIDPEDRSYIDNWTNDKMCKGRMDWVIAKNEEMTEETHRKVGRISHPVDPGDEHMSVVTLHSCSLDSAPEYSWDKGVQQVGKIEVRFGKENMKKFKNRRIDGTMSKVYKLVFDVHIDFGTNSGELEVRTLVKDKVSGRTTIVFE